MQNKVKKVRLKGNESFNFREGWLRKGIRCISRYPNLFSRDDVMEQLGVGSKMVKSIKYWLLATNICIEKHTNGGRSRELILTDDYGKVISQYDPYFDDIFTLFTLHYQIVKNDVLCMPWNLFFNEYNGVDFFKEDMVSVCASLLNKRLEEGSTFSESLFLDDCSSILRMYLKPTEIEDPEESLQCPLSSLGLLAKSTKNKNAYIKTSPAKDELHQLAVLYVIVSNLPKNKQSVGINELVAGTNNIGRVFNLNRVKVNEYLDQLKVSGYLTINRTAGLDMVYLNDSITPADVLTTYYEEVLVR